MMGFNWVVAVLMLSLLLNGDYIRATVTQSPSEEPSGQPTGQPTTMPSTPTGQPTTQPTSQPSIPTGQPTSSPSIPTGAPTGQPSQRPTAQPSSEPSGQPSAQPSALPSTQPSGQPSSKPTLAATGGVFTVPVTDHGDAPFDYSTQLNPCSAAHWLPQPSSSCTLRAALAFCMHNVPWNSNATDLPRAHPTRCIIRLDRAAHGTDILLTAGAVGLPSRGAAANITVEVFGDGVTVKAGATGTNAFGFHHRRPPHPEQARSYGVHLLLSDLRFSGFRSSSAQEGGAVHLSGFSSVQLEALRFSDNRGGLGGALHVSNCSQVSLSDVRFERSRGVAGGALFSRHVHGLQVSDCVFAEGAAETVGGAVAVDSCHSVSISRCTLTDNQAGQHGGALAAHRIAGGLHLATLAIRGNSAAYGPGICLRQAVNVVLDNNTITANTAAVSAAVYWIRDDHLPASAKMLPPSVLGSNVFGDNHYGASQPDAYNLSTEVMRLRTSPAALHLEDYVNDDSLQMQVSLLDFYGHGVALEAASLELLVRAENAGGCSYNKERAVITGSADATSLNAGAWFDGFGVRCIPGGHVNISIVSAFSVAATNFPLYEVPSDTQKALFDSKKRTFESLVPISLRTCRVGEYYDFENSQGRDACRVCRNGYTMKNNTANQVIQCETCPENSLNCYSDKVILHPGTWRHARDSKKVFYCPMPGGCLGGESYGQAACSAGYAGALCSRCDNHYAIAPDRQSCESCGERSPSEQLVIPFVLLALLLLAILIYYGLRLHHHHMLMHQVHPLKNTSHEAILEMQERMQKQERWFEALMQYSPRIKIVITSYQIVALLPENLHTQRVGALIGRNFDRFVKWITWVNFDTLRAMPISCYRAWNYIDSMKAITSIPIGVSFCLVCTYGIYIRYYHYHYKPSHMYPQDNLQAYFKQIPIVSDIAEQNFEEEVRLIRQSLFSRYVFVAVICSYFSVPAVLLSVLNIFDCVDLDPHNEDPAPFLVGQSRSSSYMRVDMSINCGSSQYLEGRKFVVAACVIYPIAFSVMYYTLFHRAKKFSQMVSDGHVDIKNISAPIRFLFSESYRDGFYFWEFVDMGKRLLLIVALAYINDGTQMQIVWGMMITLLLFKLQCHCQPYVKSRDNSWAELGYAQIFCTLFGFLIYRSRALDTSPELYPVLDFAMVAVNGAFILMVAWDMNSFWLQKLGSKLFGCLRCVFTAATRDKSRDNNNSKARALQAKWDKAAQIKLIDDNAAAQKCRQDATETAEKFLHGSSGGHSEYVQTLVHDVIATAIFQPSFRKSRPQQKHLRNKGIRQKEMAFMKSNFKELLEMLQTPGNALVDVLDLDDPHVTLDAINKYKLHLEDSLTAAENVLEKQREDREQLLVKQGLPYDALGNLGDIARVDRSDKRFFHTDAWLPPAHALNDNRMYRTVVRHAEKVQRDEDSHYIKIGAADAARALQALTSCEGFLETEDDEDDEDDYGEDSEEGDWDQVSVGSQQENSEAGDNEPKTVAITAQSPASTSPLPSSSSQQEQEDSEIDSTSSHAGAPRIAKHHHHDQLYALSSGDEDTETDDDYGVAIRMPTTTRDAFEISDSSDDDSNISDSQTASETGSGSVSEASSSTGYSLSQTDSEDESIGQPVRL